MSDKIKCVITDDEHLARKLLKDYISKLPQLELVGVFEGPIELMVFLASNEVDLLFLDIQMPDITGIDFLKTTQVKPSVIFTTAYSEYALQGYELNVIEYLLKPIPFPRFLKAVTKAEELILLKKGQGNKSIQPATTPHNSTPETNYINIKADRKVHKLFFEELLYIEGAMEYVHFHTATKKITAYYSLKELSNKLPSYFVRIHKSYIANMNKATTLEGNILSVGNAQLSVGGSHRKEVVAFFE